MNKEYILEKSKKENKNGNEKDFRDRQTSYAVGGIVATFLSLILSMTESSIFNRSDNALWRVYSGTCFSISLVGVIKSQKKWLWIPMIITEIAIVGLTVPYCLGK